MRSESCEAESCELDNELTSDLLVTRHKKLQILVMGPSGYVL